MEIREFARKRMARFNLTEEDITSVLDDEPSYGDRNSGFAHVGELPDGRKVKVKVRDGEIIDAFTHK